jgi:putative tryptophan/tyrosine transport system substrate-binding protein
MKALLVKILIAVLFAALVGVSRAENIAVLMSSDASAYQEALEGFRETTRHRIVGVQTLKENPATWRDELKKLRTTIEPDLVFVIGTSALQAVAGEITNIPVIYAMVFNPFAVANSSAKNITGISMIPALSQSIALLKELNPKYRRIGVMFDPTRSGALLSQARSISQKENLQLVSKEIRAAGEIAGALKSLENEIDVLWLWPDEAYLVDDILQRIFLFSFDSKLPVLGLSERHTEMGAVLSLSHANAKDMGRQAGETASKLLAETKLVHSPPSPPRETKLTVNLNTARKLGLEVPGSIIRRAENGVNAPVYKEGEWWVFRIKTLYSDGRSDVEEHRVVYKDGKFETEHPSFLTGADIAGTPTFLPFPSLHVTNPQRSWLDFPLLPGKRWSFRYPRRYYLGRGSRTTAVANGEVIGPLSQPLVTPAGKFDAIEIQRIDSLAVPAYLTYFYSPLTKSVIRSRAGLAPEGGSSSGRRFELDLVAYGNR